MAEGVDHGPGRYAVPDAGSGVEPFDQVSHLVSGQAASSGVDQEGGGGMVEVVVGEAGGTAGLVGGEDLFEGGVDRDGTGLAALAGRLEAPGAGRAGDRGHAQGHGLAFPDA